MKSNGAKGFEEQGVEVVAVFREEKLGVKGLQMIKDQTKTDFTLAIDTPAKATADYSTGKKKFHNYVVDKNGIIQGVIDGSVRTRAQSAQLLEIIGSLASTSTAAPAMMEDKAAVERAVLDYVEGIYQVKPDLIKRGVHPDVKMFGYMGDAKERKAMNFSELSTFASKHNATGKIAKDAAKKVQIYDVMDKVASAKLTSAWGTDMLQLVKEDGKWMVLQILSQGAAK